MTCITIRTYFLLLLLQTQFVTTGSFRQLNLFENKDKNECLSALCHARSIINRSLTHLVSCQIL